MKTILRLARCKEQADVLDATGVIGCKYAAKNFRTTFFRTWGGTDQLWSTDQKRIFETSKISNKLRWWCQQVFNQDSSIYPWLNYLHVITML